MTDKPDSLLDIRFRVTVEAFLPIDKKFALMQERMLSDMPSAVIMRDHVRGDENPTDPVDRIGLVLLQMSHSLIASILYSLAARSRVLDTTHDFYSEVNRWILAGCPPLPDEVN